MNTLALINNILEDVFPATTDIGPSNQMTNYHYWQPRVDLHEEKEKYILTADLPGLNDKDVKIEFDDGVLAISGERSTEKEKSDNKNSYYYRERVYGKFERSFNFGNSVDADNVKASMKNGILTVELIKREPKKVKLITIEH
ncbi:MAG: Hsp20/alpha crystallin family protein [Oligoflexia bacterium]|nr:Hsp20/alpha crystallin family protein [Oligoflexia bacterium]